MANIPSPPSARFSLYRLILKLEFTFFASSYAPYLSCQGMLCLRCHSLRKGVNIPWNMRLRDGIKIREAITFWPRQVQWRLWSLGALKKDRTSCDLDRSPLRLNSLLDNMPLMTCGTSMGRPSSFHTLLFPCSAYWTSFLICKAKIWMSTEHISWIAQMS